MFDFKNKEVVESITKYGYYAEVDEDVKEDHFDFHTVYSEVVTVEKGIESFDYETVLPIIKNTLSSALMNHVEVCSLQIRRTTHHIPTISITMRYVYGKKIMID